jgi:hypothetical protein
MLSRRVRNGSRLCFTGRVRTGTLKSDENDVSLGNAVLLHLVPRTWIGVAFPVLKHGEAENPVREFPNQVLRAA